MLKRKAYSKFFSWFKNEPHKALLVKGARQVGKSYLVGKFASDASASVVSFDLLEDSALRNSFSQATSAEDLILRMSVAATAPLVSGESIVVIDEVQECPNILTFIKYLVQKTDYRFMLTGSLLGVKLKNIDSLPVGYVTQVEMYPLDFEEFCWASGVDASVFNLAKDCLIKTEPLPDYLYNRLKGLFHRYLMVGGMPDAVSSFIATNNIDSVRSIHTDLKSLYLGDITKHAPQELRPILRDIFSLIPAEAITSTRRFKLSDLKDVRRYSQVHQHFLWITQAGVALPVYNVNAPIFPLLVSEQRNTFKLFYLDSGLLASNFPKSAYDGLLEGKASMNMGAVYEAFVAQELKAHGFDLRYFSSKKIGELDFVEETADGKVLAFEVKSGSKYKTHAALDNAMGVEDYTIDKAIVLAETNIERSGKILYLPVFMVSMFEKESISPLLCQTTSGIC